ncbi:SDR family NAD(P)-dependent oxidoreductase [Nocardioides daeguensis]|uniref:SDR family NAD(P)-dependent oxidoreductase n=1 Tax=Nocardioides daeguensis TaxID=908359 RepID=A0ABP6VX01_9ACTN|nr:SDR family NAD(P)-dependent oxidoreductase [Nocardioides daeguensis]MBV6729728.1 SDR family NAD(P)-dependent oxidoreductase [Nocardioides daeguensis]MCR1772459.1 SDR family NAD(P)-dependent oxidoreductase [Nocardioides daeguensis]
MVASIPPTFLAAGRFAHESEVVSGPRSALITGASRGMGRSIALRLARKGYGVTIAARGAGELAAVAEELAAAGAPQVEVVAADSADRDAVAGVAEAHRARFGAMDALVLNAGGGTTGALEQTDLRRLGKSFEEAGNGVTATAIAPAFVDTDIAAWVSEVIEPGSMIPTSDIVDVVEMPLGLGSSSVIGRIVMSRSGTSGYCA